MININEVKLGNDISYEIQLIDSSKIISVSNVHYRAFVKVYNDINYMMIYNKKHELHSESFQYLNYAIYDKSINTRIQSMTALKLLFSFEEIINTPFAKFSSVDFTNLKNFLKGVSYKGNSYSFNLSTTRSNSTVNSYLTIYRQFFKYLGIRNSFIDQKNKNPHSFTGSNYSSNKYKINEKLPNKPIEVPRYISIYEFEDIIKEVRANYTLRDEIIIRLMFENGLRIGEVLGLTAEDLVVEKIGDKYITIANIRNRFSDKNDQKAKTCMKIISRSQYQSSDYAISGFGFQKVVLSDELFQLIDEYIENIHIKAREEYSINYWKNCVADKVVSNSTVDDNYYIFINSIGNPLHSHLWNTTLRKIFKSVGIAVDENTRTHNLNHRFRHGYAMFCIQHLNLNQLELMERMRHSSVESVALYYKPTLTDSINLKNSFTKSMYELIPTLGKGR